MQRNFPAFSQHRKLWSDLSCGARNRARESHVNSKSNDACERKSRDFAFLRCYFAAAKRWTRRKTRDRGYHGIGLIVLRHGNLARPAGALVARDNSPLVLIRSFVPRARLFGDRLIRRRRVTCFVVGYKERDRPFSGQIVIIFNRSVEKRNNGYEKKRSNEHCIFYIYIYIWHFVS